MLLTGQSKMPGEAHQTHKELRWGGRNMLNSHLSNTSAMEEWENDKILFLKIMIF